MGYFALTSPWGIQCHEANSVGRSCILSERPRSLKDIRNLPVSNRRPKSMWDWPQPDPVGTMLWTLATVLLLIALIGGLVLWSARRLVPPEVKLVSIRPERLEMQQQTLRAELRVSNPNPIPLPIRAMSYRLWLDEQEIASGSGRFRRWIPAAGAETIEVLVSGDSRHLAKRLPRLALKRQPWPYRVAGTLTPIGLIQIGYDHRGQIDAAGILKLAASLR